MQTIASRGPPQRSFRGDVDGRGFDRLDELGQSRPHRKCQPNIRICRTGDAAKMIGSNDLGDVTQRGEFDK